MPLDYFILYICFLKRLRTQGCSQMSLTLSMEKSLKMDFALFRSFAFFKISQDFFSLTRFLNSRIINCTVQTFAQVYRTRRIPGVPRGQPSIDTTENLLDVTLLILWLCTDYSERIQCQRKVKRHPYSACFWLNHLTLISDVSEERIGKGQFQDKTTTFCRQNRFNVSTTIKIDSTFLQNRFIIVSTTISKTKSSFIN